MTSPPNADNSQPAKLPDTFWNRVRYAKTLKTAEITLACNLFRDWTGLPITEATINCLAHRIGCGATPNSAAASEFAYRLVRVFDPLRTTPRHWMGQPVTDAGESWPACSIQPGRV